MCSWLICLLPPTVEAERPFANVRHTGLLVEALLELGPLKLDGVFLQLGLEALDRVVHHVHLHQPQHLEDPSKQERRIVLGKGPDGREARRVPGHAGLALSPPFTERTDSQDQGPREQVAHGHALSTETRVWWCTTGDPPLGEPNRDTL